MREVTAMKKINMVAMALCVLLLNGCASNPNKIEATYVSPLVYKDYDCEQIAMEMNHVSRRTNECKLPCQVDSSKVEFPGIDCRPICFL